MPELRAALLDALDQLNCPLGQPELSAYLRVFHDHDLHLGDLAKIHRAEQQAYRAGEQRDVWLCPAILDFILGVRVQQGRPAAHLLGQQATKRAELLLCADDILAVLRTIEDEDEDEHLVDERLAAFEGDLSFQLMLWYEAAEDAYASLIDDDDQLRERAAKKPGRLSEEATLFGARSAG